ncbi:MAG: DUF3311 domain-containing protein [Fuerstiella sp.]|nr:DUF3311 domain-containing protein [Fuerstiella sp.]
MNVRYVIWLLILLLVILHQDLWLWSDGRLIMGFLPAGLAYHIGLTIAAAVTWWLATKLVWPADDVTPDPDSGGSES